MTRTTAIILAAVVATTGLAAPALAQQHGSPQGDSTVNIQGTQGAFADKAVMMPFFNVLKEAHDLGDKVDLAAMENKIRALAPTLAGGQPSKAMEDHVLGLAHQALAMGVAKPKMFESYETFMTEMLGPE